MTRWFCFSAAFGVVLSLAGCVSNSPTYHATATSTNEAAIVAGTMTPLGARKAALQAVDGVYVGFWQAQSISPILVDPGQRTLAVQGQYIGFFTHGDANAELKANLQAGRAYQIKAELKKWNMTFWIEDLVSHEAASVRQTNQVSWMINFGGL